MGPYVMLMLSEAHFRYFALYDKKKDLFIYCNIPSPKWSNWKIAKQFSMNYKKALGN